MTKRLILMNSAVITKSGTYVAREITPDEARDIVRKSQELGREIISYVGYEQTAEYMSKTLGIDVPLNRGQVDLQKVDIMLVCKLKYRVANPATKGAPVSEDDFEWMEVMYL